MLFLVAVKCVIVRCVMGDSKRYCANWSKSMKFSTLIDFHMLYPNLPGAKANYQCCRHLGRFKMAACQKQIFPLCRRNVEQLQIKPLFRSFWHKESEYDIWFTVVWTGVPLFKNSIWPTVKIENIKNLLPYVSNWTLQMLLFAMICMYHAILTSVSDHLTT